MTELRSILLAEDNSNDVELTLAGLAELRLANEVVVVRDGAEALDYLHSRGKYASRANGNPAVILLDLKMPKMDGLEVLREIKTNERLKSIPVVMLTSSAQESDLVKSYRLGVNAYVVKPVNYREFINAIKQVGAFWLEMEDLPAELYRVGTREQFARALDAGGYDVIISDYSVPSFDGLAALALAREQRGNIPFILFSGTIGEEAAIESLHNGATDYVLKQRPERLIASLRRALQEFEDRRRRQQAEEALREREEFFRLISESVTDLIAVIDLAGQWVYNSPSYKSILGDPEQLRGADSFDAIHPEDRERMRRIFRETIATGAGQRAEFRFLLRDGSVRYIESQGSVMRDKDGRAANVIIVSRDVTGRKQAEEQIREQAALLDKAQDAICVTDMEQRILYWNRSAEVLYGWTAAEAAGKQANDLLFRNDSSHQMEALRSLLARGEWKGELCQVTKGGAEIIVESHFTLVQDGAGKPKSILVINTDVTEKKTLETQFFRSQRLENIGMLASGIAHDLNNVLAPMMMAVPMLRERVDNPADRKLLDMLDRSVRRGAELVRQILSFARGAEGGHKLLQPKRSPNPSGSGKISIPNCGPFAATRHKSTRCCSTSASMRATPCSRAARWRSPPGTSGSPASKRSPTPTQNRARSCPSAWPTPARASRLNCSRRFSSRSSPPRNPARGPAWAWPECAVF